MNIITLIISSVSLILSGYAIYRTMPATSAPDAGTLGAGGGGRR